MPKPVNSFGFVKPACLTTLFFFISFFIFSQTVLLKGVVRDEVTLKPIQNVNIKVYGSTKGTSTDHTGSFSLRLNKLPASLLITCIGYEIAYYEITGIPGDPVEFLLNPKSYTLQEVEIATHKYSYLFKDRDYSVLDYELMGDNILLLVFRYQLRRSELILLDRSGDTLAISKLPEAPPDLLFRDFLANVHYFSEAGNSYQCYFDEFNNKIDFIYKIRVDSIRDLVRPYLFEMSDRLYFREIRANGFGATIGYFAKGNVKKYIWQFTDEKKLSDFMDDQKFYASWNNLISGSDNTNFESFSRGQFYDQYEARAHQFEFFNMSFPVLKIGEDTIAVFNFGGDRIELMNKDGKIMKSVPIDFHKGSISNTGSHYAFKESASGWRWGNTVLTDNYYHSVYTLFHKNGMVRLRQVDLESGKLSRGTVLPLPFPEKIEIYKREAYFLIKSEGANEKWKLVKCKL